MKTTKKSKGGGGKSPHRPPINPPLIPSVPKSIRLGKKSLGMLSCFFNFWIFLLFLEKTRWNITPDLGPGLVLFCFNLIFGPVAYGLGFALVFRELCRFDRCPVKTITVRWLPPCSPGMFDVTQLNHNSPCSAPLSCSRALPVEESYTFGWLRYRSFRRPNRSNIVFEPLWKLR